MPLTQIINYDVPGNFTFDPVKVEVVSGVARLKLLELDEDFNEDFASDVGFTFDSAKTEFVAGSMQQRDQRPPGSPSFGANYASSINGNWGGGALTGTATGGASVIAGRLDLRDFGKFVDYAAAGNADSAQVGAVRFKFTPNYSTKPVGGWNIFFTISNGAGNDSNRIEMRQSSSAGQIQLRMNNSAGGSLGTFTLANWNPTAGVTYEIEFNWDLTGGTHRVFIDGVLHDSFSVTGTRSTAATLLRVGADYNNADQSDGQYDDFVVYPTVQHTANYTPGYTVPDTSYTIDVITLPAFTHVGPVGSTLKSFDAFTVSETAAPRYTVAVDGGSDLYWNGSAWVASANTHATASPSAAVDTNIASIPGADGATSIVVKAYWPESNTQHAIDDLTFETTGQTQYPTDDPTIRPVSGISADVFLSFAAVLAAAGSDEIRWTISVDGVLKWWDGGAWANSDGTFAQTNTAADVNANAASLDISAGVTLKPVAHLHSDDGSTTPDLTSATFDYSFFVVAAPEPNTCIVYGWVWSLDGTPKVGSTVRVKSWKFEHGAYAVNFFAEVVTDASGYWEMNIVETETIGLRPYEVFVDNVRIARDAQVPDALSASFDTLIKRFVAA